MAGKVRTGGARSKGMQKWFRWLRESQARCWTGGHNTKELARRCAGCGEPIRVGKLLTVKVVSWIGGLRPKRRTHWEYWHRECWNKTWR